MVVLLYFSYYYSLMSFLDFCGLRAWAGRGNAPAASVKASGVVVQTRPRRSLALHRTTNATLTMFLEYEAQLDNDDMAADDHASDMEALGMAVSHY